MGQERYADTSLGEDRPIPCPSRSQKAKRQKTAATSAVVIWPLTSEQTRQTPSWEAPLACKVLCKVWLTETAPRRRRLPAKNSEIAARESRRSFERHDWLSDLIAGMNHTNPVRASARGSSHHGASIGELNESLVTRPYGTVSTLCTKTALKRPTKLHLFLLRKLGCNRPRLAGAASHHTIYEQQDRNQECIDWIGFGRYCYARHCGSILTRFSRPLSGWRHRESRTDP